MRDKLVDSINSLSDYCRKPYSRCTQQAANIRIVLNEVKRLEAIVAKYHAMEARILTDLELSDAQIAADKAAKEKE